MTDSPMEPVRPQAAEVRRRSIFTEVGLVDEDTMRDERSPAPIATTFKHLRPTRTVRFRSRNSVFGEAEKEKDDESDWESVVDEEESHTLTAPPIVLSSAPSTMPLRFYRLGIFAFVLAIMLPIFSMNPAARFGVRGGTIPASTIEARADGSVLVEKREDSPTDACKRWAGQSTVVNGTLYMYGFQKNTSPKDDQNTWNNDFLTIDLTKSWQIASPALTGLPRPSGPPEVSLGALWGSTSSLWLYGGMVSDKPSRQPPSNSVWEYNIVNKEWIEHKDPKTSAGSSADGDGQMVQRAAEGAAFSVASLGRAWYFAGHQDLYTTQGWSYLTPRVYLKSLLEFTFPGFGNPAVEGLKGDSKAGQDGAYRNITGAGTQSAGSFPQRADGVLTYIPGYGEEGILIGLTGGDNDTFTQMNVIDVYDIAKSTWYRQNTGGSKVPPYRVNPCATVAAAADGSSYNVYMYGGQNLQPATQQTQKDDMWILSVPSFTWIQVDQKGTPPYARAGHSCHIWDGQMISVGGYIDPNLSCESPGIYVFNMTSLEWKDQFTALTGDKVKQAYNGQKDSKGNPFAQQGNQRGVGPTAGLQGSYGYAVPQQVQQVIGGQATGGATLTAPSQTPTAGPFATGKPQTYTVTGPNGAVITEVTNSGGYAPAAPSGPNIGAIVAGVIAGVFFIVACYFAFCAWVYRKQVAIWKNHAAMVQTRANNEKQGTITSSSGGGGKISSERPPATLGSSHGAAAGSFDIGRVGGGSGEHAYAGAAGDWGRRRSSEGSVHEDLLSGQEPSFWGTRGVLLNPRRSLRVINRD